LTLWTDWPFGRHYEELVSRSIYYLLLLIEEDLHNGSTSSVRIGSTLSASYTCTSGVRQGCVLAPALFCRAIDWIMERVASTVGFSLCNAHFTDLDYADDVALLAHAMDDLHTTLEVFETTASQLGLHVSWQKTKIQNLGAGVPTSNLSVCGQSVDEVAEFTYLGSVQSTTGGCQPDILRRIGIASTAIVDVNPGH